MFWVILIVIVVLFVLVKLGVFRKEGQCNHCNAPLKGTEQVVIGSGERKFILCKECYGKIHPSLTRYAKEHWTYSRYQDYLVWEEETKEERANFEATDEYGYGTRLRIDTEKCLFTLGSGKNDLVLRFCDLMRADINFKPGEVKDGVFSTKVKGDEYASIQMTRPAVYLEEVLNYGASYKLREQGFINKKYEYDLSPAFMEIIRAFSICMYITQNAQNTQGSQSAHTAQEIDEVQKALALFMFDSMEEVTEESLKKQRNSLIKAFHPDNNENNEAYSQKINAAYEVLSDLL